MHKQEFNYDRNKMVPVLEIFQSIQGEGSMMGQAVTFIRTPGCNLKCPWCDTKNSWEDIGEFTFYPVHSIVKKCLGVDNVVITGGEPCLHLGLEDLIEGLHEAGHYVAIETNGTLPTPENADWVVCSPKPTNDINTNYFIHPECRYDELKFVVTPELAFERYVLPHVFDAMNYKQIAPVVWLQPNGFDMEKSAKLAQEYVMKYPNTTLRLGIQLHKIFDFR